MCNHYVMVYLYLLSCFWKGKASFSDGTVGSVALSTCGRNTIPHAIYLQDYFASMDSANYIHYVSGLIVKHESDVKYVIEPREFIHFRKATATASPSKHLTEPGKLFVFQLWILSWILTCIDPAII